MPGLSGPPPTPTSLAEARERRSHRPTNDAEPKLVAGEPELPYFVSELDRIAIERALADMTMPALQAQARELAIKSYSRLRKPQLIEKLRAVIQGPRAQAWAYLYKTLEPMRVVTPADGASFAMAVEALVEYIEDTRTLAREGRFWTTEGRYGTQTKRHPAIESQGKAWNRFQSMLDRFGANPAYRAKVQIAASAAANRSPWDALNDPLGELSDPNAGAS